MSADMIYQTSLFEITEGVARLTLNRPDRLNSFNVQMHQEVRDALGQAAASRDARVLVLTGLDTERTITRVICPADSLQLVCKPMPVQAGTKAARIRFVVPKPKA